MPKGLAVTGVVFAILKIEAFVTDIQSQVTATADCPSCIVLAGDARIQCRPPVVVS
jgi:hypothetical protein